MHMDYTGDGMWSQLTLRVHVSVINQIYGLREVELVEGNNTSTVLRETVPINKQDKKLLIKTQLYACVSCQEGHTYAPHKCSVLFTGTTKLAFSTPLYLYTYLLDCLYQIYVILYPP